MSKPRILWFGDGSPVTTGFGRVADSVLGGLYDTNKYDIVQLGLNYYGDPHNKPYKVFPLRYGDRYGRNRLYEVLRGMEPDIFITNNDIWAMDWCALDLNRVRQETGKRIPWVAYFPIDGLPIKLKWLSFIKNYIDYPITYTKWAVDAFKEVDKNIHIDQIYHGVDTAIFKPRPNIKKQFCDQLSKDMGREINFVIGYVGRNQPRKRLPELMLAFTDFAKDKDDVILYLHTSSPDMGWNLVELRRTMSIGEGKVLMTPDHMPSSGMDNHSLAMLYNAFDVLCLPTIGEGFGLPLVEGMASGCAVVSTKCSCVPEIVGDGAILVNPGYVEILPFDNELLRPIPSVSEMSAAFNELYKNRELLKTIQDKALKQSEEFSSWFIDEWQVIIDKAIEDSFRPAKSGMLDFDMSILEEV